MSLTLQQLQALSTVVEATQDTVLPDGTVVTQRPVGVRNFIRFMVRDFASVRNQFVAPTKALAPVAARLGNDASEDAFAAAAGGAIGGMMGDLIDARIDDGLDADARFVALTLCNATNPQELRGWEAAVKGLPDAVFDALFAGAKAVTYGGDVAGFFDRVRASLTKMEALESRAA